MERTLPQQEHHVSKSVLASLKELKRAIWESPQCEGIRRDPHAFAMGLGGLRSPLWIPGMEEAVELLYATIARKGRVRVIGDRDVDGVSSTAMLGNFLRQSYRAQPDLVELVVSDDGDDYGLSGEVLKKTVESRPDLVILLDMGSSHGPEIRRLTDSGVRVIVLDHHQLHDRLPDTSSVAFVNPMRLSEKERRRFLHEGRVATAGLVFKFLLGYALRHTQEWFTIYSIQSAVPSDKQSKIYYYRMGERLAADDALALLQTSGPSRDPASAFREIRLHPQASLPWPSEVWQEGERDFLFRHPNEAGPILLAKALESRQKLREFVYQQSELAAIGLISDLVPLVDENRAMVRIGLGRTRPFDGWKNPGLEALIAKLRLAPTALSSRDVAWSVGPAVNAAGRMGQTHKALAVLIEKDKKRAQELAAELVGLNKERKERTSANEEIVRSHFVEFPEKLKQPFIFCYHPELKKGVSGIVATRLTEKYKRPAIYLHREDEKHAKGSARTWDGVNVLKLIDRCRDLFLQHGGHPEAAGFSILIEHVELLEKRLLEVAREGMPQIAGEAQSEVRSFSIAPGLVGPDLLSFLDTLEPFGAMNEEPEFLLERVAPENLISLSHGIHAKFKLKGVSRSVDFVLWRRGAELRTTLEKSPFLNLRGHLERNYFAGKTRLQFRVEDFSSCTESEKT